MEKALDNSLSMFTTVKSVVNKYNSVWKDAVWFKTAVEELLTNTAGIEDLSKGIESKTSGVTKLKNETKIELSEGIFEITSQMQVYFKRTKDTVNLQKVKISKSSIKVCAKTSCCRIQLKYRTC